MNFTCLVNKIQFCLILSLSRAITRRICFNLVALSALPFVNCPLSNSRVLTETFNFVRSIKWLVTWIFCGFSNFSGIYMHFMHFNWCTILLLYLIFRILKVSTPNSSGTPKLSPGGKPLNFWESRDLSDLRKNQKFLRCVLHSLSGLEWLNHGGFWVKIKVWIFPLGIMS